jgi:hypothetical protein
MDAMYELLLNRSDVRKAFEHQNLLVTNGSTGPNDLDAKRSGH